MVHLIRHTSVLILTILLFTVLVGCEHRSMRQGEAIKEKPTRLKLAVAILPFEDDTHEMGELGLLIRRHLMENLKEENRFVVVSEERMRKAMFEQLRNVTGAKVEDKDLARLGYALEANLLITGTVHQMKRGGEDLDYVIGERHDRDATIKVTTRVFDVWKQTPLVEFTVTGETSRQSTHTFTLGEQPLQGDALLRKASRSAVLQMIPTLVRTAHPMNWGARVTNLDAEEHVVIGAGHLSGLQVKDELEVFGLPGERVERSMLRAPDNPLVKKGKIEIVRLLGHNYARAKVSEGGPVKVGDLVRVAILTPSSEGEAMPGSPMPAADGTAPAADGTAPAADGAAPAADGAAPAADGAAPAADGAAPAADGAAPAADGAAPAADGAAPAADGAAPAADGAAPAADGAAPAADGAAPAATP